MKKKPVAAGERRTYRSVRRAEQAEETRRHILEAASKSFLARGYAKTTIAQIAAEAGTSTETVYAAFGTKPTLLARAVQAALAVDGKGPLASADADAVRREPNPREHLRLFARDIAKVLARVSALFDVLWSARGEPGIDALYRRMQKGRLENLRVMVGWLADKGGLRPGLDPDQAAETVWALASPQLYRMLTEVQGWSSDRFAMWLAETLGATLLPPEQPHRGRGPD